MSVERITLGNQMIFPKPPDIGDMDVDDDSNTFNKSPKMGSKDCLLSPKVGSKDCLLMKLGKQLLQKAKLGEAEEVKNLMSIGAPFTANMVGTSPLHWAVYYNHLEVTELLLKAGISRDARNKVDRTPCHIAAQKGFMPVLRLLLAYGADVNSKDMLRMTPLHWAAQGGSISCTQLLLNYGCDTNCESKFDKTAVQIAKDNCHYELARLIEETSQEDPEARMVKVKHFKEGNRIIAVKRSKIEELEGNNIGLTGDVDNAVTPSPTSSPKNRIGIFMTKPDPVTGVQSTLELINDNDPSEEDKGSKKIKKAMKECKIINIAAKQVVQAPSAKRTPLIITDDGKLILNSEKIGTIAPKGGAKFITTPKLVPVNNQNIQAFNVTKGPKKIIKVNAAQLINMTKEKKLCIRPPPLQIIKTSTPTNVRQTPDAKISVEDRLKARLELARKEAEELRKSLEMKEREITNYERQLKNLSRLES